MPHPFRITLKSKLSGESEQQSGEFGDADWHQLTRYLECAHRLAACRMAETQSQLHIHFRGELGKPTNWEVSLPPEDDIAAFLLRMRPFILASEPTSFVKTRKTLRRYVTIPSARRYLDQLRDRYAGNAMPFAITVGSEAGEMSLSTNEAILKWLNAFEYHQDEEKQAYLRSMYAVFPEHSARAIFLYALLERAAAIGKLGALIDGLSKREGRELEVR